jgi:hypothetical protein
MTVSKRTTLGISLGVIVLHWIYQIVSERSALEPVIAHAFSDVLAMLAATMLAQ